MKSKNIYEVYGRNQNVEAFEILKKRLTVNKISLNLIKNKNVLNICDPSGRYSHALYKIGAKTVDTLNETPKPENWNNKFFFKKVNLSKKIKINKSYDLIFCNGILSHKKNWKQILKNMSKFLNKSGYLWLSLYSNGNHWKVADKVKKKLDNSIQKNFIMSLKYRDWEPNKINFLVELFFKNRIYFSKKQISNYLKKIKYKKIIFLNRGIKTDLNEKIYNDYKLKEIYGEGEIRLLAKRDF